MKKMTLRLLRQLAATLRPLPKSSGNAEALFI